jgi:hypothetical protein
VRSYDKFNPNSHAIGTFVGGSVSIHRKWLQALMLAMMAVGSFASPMDPKEIEELISTMNQTRIEFTLRNEDDRSDGEKPVEKP